MLPSKLRAALLSTRAAAMTTARPMSTSNRPDRREMYDRMIRVDQAGEFGADRIYAGQMAILGNTDAGRVVQEMWEQEKAHLKMFNELIDRHGVRQSALMPFWNVAGFALGAGSALLGKEMAMACTIAVETVITEHYNEQIKELTEDSPEENKDLLEVLKKCRDDEEHHHDLGIVHRGMEAPLYDVASCFIKAGCRLAIAAAERI